MTNGAYERYLSTVQDLIGKICQEQLEKAADLLAETIKNDRLIYVLGTSGHSYMAAEEMFYRVGGLIPVCPIFPSGLDISHGAERSRIIGRCPGYISKVLDYHSPGNGDTLLVVNPEGVNCVTIETVLKAKEMGVKVVGITSTEFCKKVPRNSASRHSSGKNMCEMEELDAIIDIKMPECDSVLSFPNVEARVSPVSTVLYMFALNALVGCTVEKLLALGIDPPVWKDHNAPEALKYNKENSEKYAARIGRL